MDRMDIDHTVDVPDTPDRLTRQAIIGRSGVEDENHGPSMLRYSRQQNILKDSSKDQPMVIDSGSRGPSMRPNNSRRPINSISSSSAISSSLRNANLFRKGVTEKNTSYPTHDSFHNYHRRSVRPSCSSKTSFHEDSFVDLTERNVNGPVIGIASPSGVPGKNPSEFKNRSGLDNVTSSLFGRANFRTASRVLSEEMKNENGVGSSNESREAVEIVDNIQEKPSNDSPRVNKQKRLVRNGCISPNNIAKAKQLAGKDSNGSVAAAHNNNNGSKPSSAPPISIDIRELVSEDNDSYTRKGKGVMTHPCSSREPDSKNKNSLSRSSINFNDEAIAVSDYSRGAGKGIEESGGWRSTRNRTRELNISLPDDEGLHVIRSKDPTRYSGQHHENRLERSDKGVSFANGDGKGPKLISSEHTSHQTLKESVSHHRTRLGRLNGSLSTANTLIKRQKQGSTSGSGGECSTSVSGGPDVVNLEQIIEVDEYSPQLRRDAHDEDARARQLEADELLARELQEQLYNELPVFGGGEVDEQMALAWQHQDDSNYDFAQERHPVLDARVSVSNSLRQSQSRSSSSAPRRGSQSRSAALGRMTRLRSRFPGQARTLLSSRGRTSMFPEDMDVDMRMHILGALEEFSDMGLNAGILQAPRDFNENDYEMLLALDDNNDQHRGASARQINGLPQSTVQSENFEETCAICLDTPTIGDTIRHLPCLHKFHKDCIDPWLRRRTSCPVCKSSVT